MKRMVLVFMFGWFACIGTMVIGGYALLLNVAPAQAQTETTSTEPLFPSLSPEANGMIEKYLTGPFKLTLDEARMMAARAFAAEQRSIDNEARVQEAATAATGALSLAQNVDGKALNNTEAVKVLYDTMIEYGFLTDADKAQFYTPVTAKAPLSARTGQPLASAD